MENKINKSSANKNNRIRWIVSIISITAVALIFNQTKKEVNQPVNLPVKVVQTPPNIEIKKERPDSAILLGRWIRSDGGYVIEIHKAAASGQLDANYFNPNPIHVGRALWAIRDKRLIIMIELRDVNYPGSTYALEYVSKEDKLYGKYFQAVEKTTYDVYFIREK